MQSCIHEQIQHIVDIRFVSLFLHKIPWIVFIDLYLFMIENFISMTATSSSHFIHLPMVFILKRADVHPFFLAPLTTVEVGPHCKPYFDLGYIN